MSSQNNIHFQSIYQYIIDYILIYFLLKYTFPKFARHTYFHNLFRKNIFYVMKNVFASYFMIDTFGELFYKHIFWKTNFFKLKSTNVFEADLLGPKTLHENGTVYKNLMVFINDIDYETLSHNLYIFLYNTNLT